MCLLRCAHRAQAEQARGRRSGGQLRNRRGYGQIRSGPYLGRRARRCGRGCRLRRRPPWDGRRGRGHDACASPAFARRGRVDGAARGARDDSAGPVRRLGMARLRAGDAGHPLERLALPPRRRAQPAPWGGDDGHPGFDRHARRLGVVSRGLARLLRRPHLFRGRRGDHDSDPARALLRGSRRPAIERGDSRPARAGREGGARSPRRRRDPRARRRASGRRPLHRSAGREDRH